MGVIFIRSNSVNPDPRIEKQVEVVLSSGRKVQIIGWQREGGKDYKSIYINEQPVNIKLAKIKAEFGSGIKNIIPLLRFQFFLALTLFTKRKEYTVIHAADFDTILPAILMKFFCKKKVIYDIYDFYVDSFSVPDSIKWFIKYVDIKCINFADVVILTTEYRIEQIKGSKPKKVEFIHNTPKECKIDDILEKQGDFFLTVSYVGILQDNRLLLEIVDLFKNKPEFQLIIAGFGKHEEYIKKASQKFTNIIFEGQVSYKKAIEISARSDVLFATYNPEVPNHKYSSANKLYEAMMLSKPIIVCKDTSMDKIVENFRSGIVINYSIDDFEHAINRLMSKELRKKMGRNGYNSYITNFSWNIMQKRLINLYSVVA